MGQLNIEVTFIDGPKKGQIWIHKNLSIPDVFEFYDNCTLGFIRETNSFVFDEDHRIELSEFMYNTVTKLESLRSDCGKSRKN